MTVVWTYPWSLEACDLDAELSILASMGVDTIEVASHYHSIQTITPRAETQKVHQYPGGCFFTPDETEFSNTPIQPQINSVPGLENPLKEICDLAENYGLSVGAWTVCNHNSRLGERNPDYRVQTAFDDAQDHSLCPSYPAVHDYFAGVLRSTTNYDVNHIGLESVGFPSMIHGHGASFGHTKNHVLTGDVEEILYTQCFCTGCQQRAESHYVNLDTAQNQVQQLLEGAMSGPETPLPSLDGLVEQYPNLKALFEFRSATIEKFLQTLEQASGTTPLNYFVADGFGLGARDGWPAGIDIARLDEYLDSVTALCYTSTPETAKKRASQVHEAFGGTTNVAISMDPKFIEQKSELERLVNVAHAEVGGDVFIYNLSLLGNDQIDWVADVIGNPPG